MADRPLKDPVWSTDADTTSEPSDGYKAAGWEGGEEPPDRVMNWWQNLAYLWLLLWRYVYSGRRVWSIERWHTTTAGLGTAYGWLGAVTSAFTVTVAAPSALMRHRYVQLSGGAGTDSALIGSNLFHYFDTNSDVDVEWTMCIATYGTSANYLVEAGIVMGAGDLVVFEKDEASGAWFYRCQAAASSTTRATTGVTATAGQVYRMRIHYAGHATTPTARFWIDDVLVGTVTDNDVPRALTGAVRFYNNAIEAVNTVGAVYIGPVAIGVR